MVLRKLIIYIAVIGMLVGLAGCRSTEDVSNSEVEVSLLPDESQTETVEKDPEIFVCRVSDELGIGEQVDEALHILGKHFLDSRVGTQEESENKIAEYGYCLIDYSNYGIARVYLPGSIEYENEAQVQNMTVQQDGSTWIVAYNASINRWGVKRPSYDGPEFSFCDWTFGDWFIVHQEGDIFQMMSYTDYQKLQKSNSENPFEAYLGVDATSMKVESWNYDCTDLGVAYVTDSGEYHFIGGTDPVPSEYVEYQETLDCYLSTHRVIFTYEAETDDISEEAARVAALALGKMYLDELCSKEYMSVAGEKYISPSEFYAISDYQDLQLTTFQNSWDRTVEKLAENMAEPEKFLKNYNSIPDDCFVVDIGAKKYLKAADNVWYIAYSASVFLENVPSSLTYMEGEGYVLNQDAGVSLSDFIMIQEGNQYTLISYNDVVPEENIVFE